MLADYGLVGLRHEAADQTKNGLLSMMTVGVPLPLSPQATEISSSSLRRNTGIDPAAGMQTPLVIVLRTCCGAASVLITAMHAAVMAPNLSAVQCAHKRKLPMV
jgi:hypothetical protein